MNEKRRIAIAWKRALRNYCFWKFAFGAHALLRSTTNARAFGLFLFYFAWLDSLYSMGRIFLQNERIKNT